LGGRWFVVDFFCFEGLENYCFVRGRGVVVTVVRDFMFVISGV